MESVHKHIRSPVQRGVLGIMRPDSIYTPAKADGLIRISAQLRSQADDFLRFAVDQHAAAAGLTVRALAAGRLDEDGTAAVRALCVKAAVAALAALGRERGLPVPPIAHQAVAEAGAAAASQLRDEGDQCGRGVPRLPRRRVAAGHGRGRASHAG